MADIQKLIGSESPLEVGQKINEIIENNAKKNLNNTGMLTNCLLEVPQRIKLELSNGVLTLKAGSEVIVPNGFEADGTTPKFDYVTVPNDVVFSATGTKANQMLTINTDNWGFGWTTTTYSGTGTETKSGAMCYRTDLNRVIYQNNVDENVPRALPFAIFSYENGVVTELSNTFNGMGFIGSTLWFDKGVKGLIPNGRNEDGSLKNFEFTTNSVQIQTTTNTAGKTWGWYFNDDGSLAGFSIGVYKKSIKKLSDRPATWTSGYCIYVEDENRNYVNQNINPSKVIMVADVEIGSTSITSLSPRTTFRAVDYNDIAGLKAYITETYVNGASGYRIWSDGFKEQFGRISVGSRSTATVTLLKTYSSTNYVAIATAIGGMNTGAHDPQNAQVKSIDSTAKFTVINGETARTVQWYTRGY